MILFSWKLPNKFIQHPVMIQGVINSIPVKKFHGYQFNFKVNKFNHKNIATHFLIAWYSHPPHFQVGQSWQLAVKLKPPIGFHNKSGFDYAASLFHKGISATGYVVTRDADTNKKLDLHNNYFVDRFRQQTQKTIFNAISNTTIAAFVSALCVGLRDGLTENDWQVFQKTGTNHLVAIAGLHIGFVVTVIYFFVRVACRQFPKLLLIIHATNIAEITALVGALCYTALSGFAIPAKRASIMLIFFMLAKLLHKPISLWKRWFLALLFILMIDPYSLCDASFWLSFFSVGILAWVMSGRLQQSHGITSWIKMQGTIAIGIFPLTLLFFQQASLIAIVTNAVAIPWIGFLILPMCLCGCVFLVFHATFISQKIFWLAGKLLFPLWTFLSKASQLSFSSWHHAIPNNFILITCMIGIIFLLAPINLNRKWLGCFGLLPIFFYHTPHPRTGEFWVTVIDVGQGLSVLVQTAHHVMLYDAGAHIPGGFDIGESVVAPYLRYKGISTIDRLEISHGDNDHSGGADAITKDFNVKTMFTSAPKLIAHFHANYCHEGQQWIWDGVRFNTLNPAPNLPYEDNNSSCVIQISNATNQVLLTGDIESQTEFELVEKYKDQLHSTVLIVPHHGSRTSSSELFLANVLPHFAVISSGKYNRYHLPAQSVVARYAKDAVHLYNTANNGAIYIRFLTDGQVKLQSELMT